MTEGATRSRAYGLPCTAVTARRSNGTTANGWADVCETRRRARCVLVTGSLIQSTPQARAGEPCAAPSWSLLTASGEA